jgi:NAD(P)H-nitrite reductase large subunit
MDKEILHLIESVDQLIPDQQEKLDGETLICECFCVNVSDIRAVCDSVVDLELLATTYNMGSGCQSCIKRRDSWINNIF